MTVSRTAQLFILILDTALKPRVVPTGSRAGALTLGAGKAPFSRPQQSVTPETLVPSYAFRFLTSLSKLTMDKPLLLFPPCNKPKFLQSTYEFQILQTAALQLPGFSQVVNNRLDFKPERAAYSRDQATLYKFSFISWPTKKRMSWEKSLFRVNGFYQKTGDS